MVSAPDDAVCIETGCTLPPTTTRPTAQPWLTNGGVIDDADEWVCVIHAASPTGRRNTDTLTSWTMVNGRVRA